MLNQLSACLIISHQETKFWDFFNWISPNASMITVKTIILILINNYCEKVVASYIINYYVVKDW